MVKNEDKIKTYKKCLPSCHFKDIIFIYSLKIDKKSVNISCLRFLVDQDSMVRKLTLCHPLTLDTLNSAQGQDTSVMCQYFYVLNGIKPQICEFEFVEHKIVLKSKLG